MAGVSFESLIARVAGVRAFSVKAVTFALIGVINTVLDYGVFLVARAAYAHTPALLTAAAHVAAACRCGAPDTILLIAANITSWAVAVTSSYVLNSTFTFAAESGRRLGWKRYGAFVAANLAGLIANTATLVFAAQMLLLPVTIAKALAILASFAVNFLLSHFVVFRVRPSPLPMGERSTFERSEKGG